MLLQFATLLLLGAPTAPATALSPCARLLTSSLRNTGAITRRGPVPLDWESIGPNKQHLLKLVFADGGLAESEGPIEYAKWELDPISANAYERMLVRADSNIRATPEIYDYAPSTDQTFEVYVNFANPKLFSMWKMDYLTQDDLQVAEHPALALLRESVGASDPDALTLDPRRREVALITDLPRLGAISTEGIYGAAFKTADPATLTRRLTKFAVSQPSNLLAMAARPVKKDELGHPYRAEDVRYHLETALTAFAAAKVAAGARRLSLHTGNWGSGAFGNDPELMALIQIIAAHAAGVDELVYHTVTADRHQSFENAVAQFERWGNRANARSIAEYVRALVALGRPYGRRAGK